MKSDKTPLYVVRLNDDGYYSKDVPWQPATYDKADVMDKKQATKVWNRMSHRWFPQAIIEPLPL